MKMKTCPKPEARLPLCCGMVNLWASWLMLQDTCASLCVRSPLWLQYLQWHQIEYVAEEESCGICGHHDQNLPDLRKQKTRHRRVSLNRVPGLGQRRAASLSSACADPAGVSLSMRRIIERSSMESPHLRKQKTRHRRVSLNMVPGPGQRRAASLSSACADPAGVSLSMRRIIERSSMESPYLRKQKTRHRRVSLNMVPGLGIEPRTQGFSIPCSTD